MILAGALDPRDVQASRGPQSVTDGPALTAHIPADWLALVAVSGDVLRARSGCP